MRIESYDILKGLGILLVMGDHCGIPLPGVLDYFEVPVFFFVAGMVMSPREDYMQFVVDKAKRLCVPYLWGAILFVALCWWTLAVKWDLKTAIMSLVVPFNQPLWFLKALFWAFVLFRSLLSLARDRRILTFLSLSSLIVGIAVGYWHEAVPNWLMIVGLPQGLVALPLVSLGYLARAYEFRKGCLSLGMLKMVAIGLVLVCACIFMCRSNIHMQHADLANPFTFYPLTVLVFIGFWLLAEGAGKLPILSYFGRNSLWYYALHMIPIQIIRWFLQ